MQQNLPVPALTQAFLGLPLAANFLPLIELHFREKVRVQFNIVLDRSNLRKHSN